MVQENRLSKVTLWDCYGCVFGLECSAELFAGGKWNTSNPQHMAASLLVKLSPVVHCDEVSTDRPGRTTALDCHGSNDHSCDGGVGFLLRTALESLQNMTTMPPIVFEQGIQY